MTSFTDIIVYLAYAMAFGTFLIFTYVVVNYRESTRALKLYADHIKATMNLREVQQFIEAYRKPRIMVWEEKGVVFVRWYVSDFRKSAPSLTVEVDKETKKPRRIRVP